MTAVSSGYHLAADEGDAYDFLSTLSIIKASGAATNNALGVVEMRLPAGFSPPPHIHHNEDEAFYLLSGQVVAQVGEQQIAAHAGSFLWLPRGVQHGFVVSADGPDGTGESSRPHLRLRPDRLPRQGGGAWVPLARCR